MNNIFEAFDGIVRRRNHYIQPDDDTSKLSLQKNKDVRLNVVFKKAQDYLNKDLVYGTTIESLGDQIRQVTIIKNNAKTLYDRYCTKTNTVWRRFLKFINANSPNFLKRILPRIFSNGVQAAEEETKKEYEAFDKSLGELRTNLNVERGNLQRSPKKPEESKTENKTPPPAPVANPPKIEENPNPVGPVIVEEPVITPEPGVEKPKEIQKIDFSTAALNLTSRIESDLSQLSGLPLPKYLKSLSTLLKNVQRLQSLNGPMNIKPFLLTLNFNAILDAISRKNYNELNDLFSATELGPDLTKLISEYTEAELIIQNMAGNTIYKYKDATGIKPERQFDQFKGHLIVQQNCLNDVLTLLSSKEGCKPSSIEINCAGPLNAELRKTVTAIAKIIPHITLNNITMVQLKSDELTTEEGKEFFSILHQIDCPALKIAIIPKDIDLYSAGKIINFLPTVNVLSQCISAFPETKKLPLPIEIQFMTEFDVTAFDLDFINHVITQCPRLQVLKANEGSEITDAQIEQWAKQGLLDHIQTIDLDSCKGISTDIVEILSKLPKLTRVILPNDLKAGKKPLSELPQFNDPFKIAMYYTSSPITRPLARELYTGPTAWASVFQIPLARQEESEIFSDHDVVLDPHSVACWLYQNDYNLLVPQNSVKTIIADGVTHLNDDNIVGFLSKFPEVTTLSLYNCPNITNVGIQALMKAETRIKKLDLTGCSNVNLLVTGNDVGPLITAKLTELNVTGTGWPQAFANVYANDPENPYHKKLILEPYTLKFTNEEIADPAFIENFLNQDLYKLVNLDFSGCTDLTDAMLGRILDLLNAPSLVPEPVSNALIDNKKKLHIATLNLSGCNQITNKVFDGDVKEDKKINMKELGSLLQIVKEGTQLTDLAKELYPRVKFTDTCEALELVTIDPEAPLKPNHVQDRIARQLFKNILDDSVDLFSEDYANRSIAFDSIEETSRFNIHKEILYANSAYFRKRLRPGGEFYNANCTFINQNATPKAAKQVVDLWYNREISNDLTWKNYGEAAEIFFRCLEGSEINFKRLLSKMHLHFSMPEAFEMLTAAKKLEDSEGPKKYEIQMIAKLKLQPSMANELKNLAVPFGLNKLLVQCNIELEKQSNALARQAQLEFDEEMARQLA